MRLIGWKGILMAVILTIILNTIVIDYSKYIKEEEVFVSLYHDHKECYSRGREAIKKPLFNPFTDIKYHSLLPGNSYYSSYHCIATGDQLQNHSLPNETRPHFLDRTCHYQNLYYNISSQTFHYYPSPTEVQLFLRQTNLSRFLNNIDVSLGIKPTYLDIPDEGGSTVMPWRPKFHLPINISEEKVRHVISTKETQAEAPKENVMRISSRNKFILYRPFKSLNPGHFIWDDVFTVFALYHLFHYSSMSSTNYVDANTATQLIPFFAEVPFKETNYNGYDYLRMCCTAVKMIDTHWKNCTRIYKKFYKAMGVEALCNGDILRTGNWLLGSDKFLPKPQNQEQGCELPLNQPPKDTEMILLPHVYVGSGKISQQGCVLDCSLHKSQLWWKFRSFLLQNLLGYEYSSSTPCEPKGYITFSLPYGSSRPDQVTWFQDEIHACENKYGSYKVKVVNLSNMTLDDQIELILNTAVFITNHGGGSFISIFLQLRASVILYSHNDVTKFDQTFYESVGYFRSNFVHMSQRVDLEHTLLLIQRELDLFNEHYNKNLHL